MKMRTRNKILAFVLAMLMIVGVLPMSVFAATGGASAQENTQTREEWVAANGGTMLFGSSFDNAGKVSGDRVNSESGNGSGSMTRTNGSAQGATVKVDTELGAMVGDSLNLEHSTTANTGDLWPQINTTNTEGKTWTMEMEIKFDAHFVPVGTGRDLMYTVHDAQSAANEQRTCVYVLYYTAIDETTWGLSISNTSDILATFKLGEMAKIAVTVSPVTRVASVYVDGKHVGSGLINANNLNYSQADGTNKGNPSFQTIRFLQMTSDKAYARRMKFELHSLYIYGGVDRPYGCEDKTDKNVAVGNYIVNNGHKIINYQGFDNYALMKNNQNAVMTFSPVDGGYLVTSRGQYFSSVQSNGQLQINTGKNANTYFIKNNDDNGYFLRFESWAKSGSGTDVYMDFYTSTAANPSNKVAAGDTIVIQGDFKKSAASDGNGWQLFDLATRIPGSRTGLGGIFANSNGDIFVDGTQSTKNKAIIGTLTSDTFTTVAFIINTTANTFSVAIDGKVVLANEPYLNATQVGYFGGDSKNILPSEMRIGQRGTSIRTEQHIDVDNLLIYSSATIDTTNFYGVETTPKADGWHKTADGYWRYYQNGNFLRGTQTIAGKTYHFGMDGFYSELEREWLFDFNNQTSGGLVAAPNLSAYDKMQNPLWKYSGLWTHIYKEGMPGNPKGGNNSWGVGSIAFNVNSGAVNPKFVRTLSELEEAAAFNLTKDGAGNYSSPIKGYKVFDFRGYDAIEFDLAIDKDVDMVIKGLSMHELGHYAWGASYYGSNYGKYDKFIKNVKNDNGTLQVGWNKIYGDLTGGSVGKLGNADTNGEPLNLVKELQLQCDWDNPNGNNYFDDVQIVIANVNLVRAVPVKSDVCPADIATVRTVDGKTYIYKDNMSDPNVGWIEYDGNKYLAGPDGALQTGVVEFYGVQYEFDDNGKLIGFADGIYTINGKNYYYQSGARKVGEFTVGEKSFNTRGDGEIVNMDGIIPGTVTGSYLAPDFSTIDTANVYVSANFNAKPTSGEGSYFGNANSGKTYYFQEQGAGTGDDALRIDAIVRRTKWRIVEDAAGDNALKVSNMTHYYDSYVDFILGGRHENDIVFDLSVKLGEDWNASGTFLQIQDRAVVTDWRAPSIAYTINNEGYILRGNTAICRLSTTEYTRVSFVHKYSGQNANYFDIYVNGIKVFTDAITDKNFRSPTQARFMQFGTGDAVGTGTIYLDDAYVYAASAPIAVDTTSEVKNGAYLENGFNRVYANGALKLGVYEVGGEIYSSNFVNGIGINGFDTNGYYVINGKVEKYQNVTSIGGKDYFFGKDYKLVKNNSAVQDLEDSRIAYVTDADGAIVEKLLFDGATYVTAGSIGNNLTSEGTETSKGTIHYNPVVGTNTFKPNQFKAETVIFSFNKPTDISDNDFIKLQLYFDSSLIGKTVNYGVVYGGRTAYYVLNGYDPATNTAQSVSTKAEYGWPEGGQYKPNGTAVYYNGMSVFTRQVDNGNGGTKTEYLARVWDYEIYYGSFTVDGTITTVDVPMYTFGNMATKAEYVSFTTVGWGIENNNTAINSYPPYEFISASFVNYSEAVEDKNGWIDGQYFVDGVVQLGWLNFEGTWYYLDPVTGYKVTGIVCVPAMPMMRTNGRFFYEFNEVGVSQGLANGIFDCSEWIYDAENDVYNEKVVKRVVKDGELLTGVVNVGKDVYYVDPDSCAVVTDTIVTTDWDNDPSTPDEPKAVGSDGLVSKVYGRWVITDAGTFYFDESGKLASGYTSIDGKYYYFDPQTNAMVKSGWATVYGVEMFFSKDGTAADGIITDEALIDRGAEEGIGYFKDGVPVTSEYTDGTYKYIFIDGMMKSKTSVSSDNPEILIFVIKDGVSNSFYFPLNNDKSFSKKFDAYACYTLEIYDVSDPDNIKKLEITDNTLAIAAGEAGHTYEVRYLPTAHNFVKVDEWYLAPTCGTDGFQGYECSVCKASYNDVILATGEHTPGAWQILKNPTCTHEGLKVAYCTGGCGTFVSEIIDRDDSVHSIVNDGQFYVYQAPTCTVDGYASGICEWCGARQETVVLPATGHSTVGVNDWTVRVHATCISKGVEVGHCANGCGAEVTREIPSDPRYHANGVNGTITSQAQAGEFFTLFQTIVKSTCATPGHGIFRCLACGGFIENVELDLDPDNHEWGEEYLVVLDEDGKIIETVHGANREEMIKNSYYICGYNGEFRRDCTNTVCVLEDGTTREFTIVSTIKSGADGAAAHNIDLDNLITTIDPLDPLYGMHFYVCTKCEKAIQATQHVMSDIRLSVDGLTHIIYCKGGCIIGEAPAASANMIGTLYSVEEDCVHELDWIYNGTTVIGHAEICKCGHIDQSTYVEHTANVMKPANDDQFHYYYCEDCGYVSGKEAHTTVVVPAQKETCYQIGWDEYITCTHPDCKYGDNPTKTYNQLPHNIPADKTAFSFDGIGHWYACQNEFDLNGDGDTDDQGEQCGYKHLYEKHSMIHIDARENTCETEGAVDHDECAICGWCDPQSFDPNDYANYPDGVIPAKGHNPAGVYHYNDTIHWQFCSNINNGVECGTIIRGEHTYVMGADFLDYSDEEGTANHKCQTCDYKKPLTGLATWWSVLGLDRAGEAGAYVYTLTVNGELVKDKLVKLPDGSYRYFDNDGKLVMNVTVYGTEQFDSITAFGPDGLSNLIATDYGYYGYTDTKAAERGAIKNAIITTADGIMMVENGAIVTGWKTIEVNGENRDYYFNSKLGDELVNADLLEGVLVKGGETITALNLAGNAAILVNVREDGSRLLGVIDNGDGTASLYLDGTAGKMPAGWVTDTYTEPGVKKVYFVLVDSTLASGKYVETPGGVYWNFDTTTYLRADSYCKNEITDKGVYLNAEGKAANNELVTFTADGKTYFIVNVEGVQSIYKEKNFVLAGDTYYVVDTATGEIDPVNGFYTGWVDEDSYSLNGKYQTSTFVAIGSDSYYFDGEGNKIVSEVVFIKSADGEAGFAWSFDANGVATKVDNSWVKFIGADGLVISDEKGYYFDVDRGLAYGLKNGTIEVGNIYIFDNNGYLIVSEENYDYNGVIYVIDETGKAKVKEEDDE